MGVTRHLQEVELVEDDVLPLASAPRTPTPGTDRAAADASDDDPTADPTADPARDPVSTARRRLRAVPRWVWPVAAVVVVGLVVTQLALDRQAEARLARLGSVPGVVAPLDAGVTELWRATEDVPTDLWEVDGLLLGTVPGPGLGVRVVGLDTATGRTQWSTPLVAPEAAGPGDDDIWGSASCVAPERPPGEGVLACTAVSRWTSSPSEPRGVVPRDVHLVVVEARSGDVLLSREVAPRSSVGTVDGDVLLASLTTENHARLDRLDPVTGTVDWTFTSPDPVRQAGDRAERGLVATAVRGDRVALFTWTRSWLLEPDGTPAHDPVDGIAIDEVGDDVVVAHVDDTGLAGHWTVTQDVVDPSGAVVARLDGPPLAVSVDDGSADDLLVGYRQAEGRIGTQVEGLVAVGLDDGRERWQLPVPGDGEGTESGTVGADALLVDGRLVLPTPGLLTAVDASTGRTLWSAQAPRWTGDAPVTDGRVVAQLESRGEGGAALVAYDLADGRRVWEAPLPDEAAWLRVVDHRLYALWGSALVALGTP